MDVLLIQISGFVLAAASVWTYFDHGIFLTLIPTQTYMIIVLFVMSIAGLILVNSLIGFLGSRFKLKSFLITVQKKRILRKKSL